MTGAVDDILTATQCAGVDMKICKVVLCTERFSVYPGCFAEYFPYPTVLQSLEGLHTRTRLLRDFCKPPVPTPGGTGVLVIRYPVAGTVFCATSIPHPTAL
ncbi:unnamed protein product [Sphacelaria rigidula]